MQKQDAPQVRYFWVSNSLYMKALQFSLLLSAITMACGGTAEKKVGSVERPGETEFTASKHVKKQNGRDNKKRVEYYNSLQYKGAYKQF